jgi:hypothetical protein
MRRFVVMFMMGISAVSGLAPQASAIVAFKRQFQKLYVKPDTDEEFAKLVKSNKTGCYVCHQGKNRKNHNPYGDELVKLLDKKKDAKDTKKIIASLRKVEEMHTDPDDEKSPTYGDLIRENKLPGGPLEEVMKEPEEGEAAARP